ncbi:cytidine deaminase 4 (CDA4) [Arabidopsis thaliana]|uniref:Probable inactive cytidine deaminase 4 n=1 Tax=Arabidopsis thaliana TaxID=3702 RepID=CDA4_ARATH|nr:Cytidine/deoxycytidylate deaminase family protein [Arabidopsis thaliana]Q9S7S2.1 RecName: Full=Probable inactive cytidine deaminase 4 [Arabidopsis thaliana]AAD30448.1 DesH [Arabidopsis thaliana]AAY78810.1 cytidine deaminase 4 [Arabidopsis thaliana]AEE85655.1 Cytidine/deoxycytidylate deaminase family protein [Arabidopsis thaliana]CAB45325.1 cytidine deaminase 4 (CDA4) [Arabidopsis thaliana]CAB79723.1 cytidine deaminase 4 (CDA4) [Arabidopsis thaliana]|eukprot:NP_194694.1 Cytidine/deoxycytidylate deaminase family protein [Arabidopsis thaliana]
MTQQLKFILTREEAASKGVSRPSDLVKLEEEAMILARAPISGVQDAVLGLASSDRIFLGVNVEFEGLPLHHSISAEQFLVANLALNFEQELHACLIPSRFYLESFEEDVPLLLVPQNNRLAHSDPFSAAEICSNPEHCSHLKCRALTAANKSNAQYSKCPSGVALICEGEVYGGWCIESAAYNLSLGPVQAALVDFMARGEGKGFEMITGAVLVEMNDAKVSQEATARILLKTIAPGCNFSVFRCHKTAEN